jgi:enterochelin esterase-like enzyme
MMAKIVAAVIAGDRMQEYGIAAKSDYQGRGSVAKNYMRYITTELIPYLIYKYPIDPLVTNHAIAGYSLGGLSAMDIAWNNPDVFLKVGVFSGSLWWRKRDTASRFYSDYRDRLMHQQIRRGRIKPGMKFWFQTGTQDEWSDRNKNGIIDSIDDTLDLIVELTKIGYRPFHDIQYLEIKDGRHNPETWADAMPYFLTWAFGK